MTLAKRRQVVVVDDNVHDIELFTTACELGEIDVDITSFTDGRAAIDAFRQRAQAGDAPAAETILLDLNMPGTNGFEVLQVVKSLEALRATRVLILTTSNSPMDRERCDALGCDGYLVKPTSFTGLVDMLKRLFSPAPA